jgi:hypothetical protein
MGLVAKKKMFRNVFKPNINKEINDQKNCITRCIMVLTLQLILLFLGQKASIEETT